MVRLTQTYLAVTDVDRSVAFHRSVFDLEVADRSDSKAVFDTGACELVLEEDFDPETLEQFGLTPPGDERGDGVFVVLEVDDVDAVYERAEEYGATVRFPPEEVPWGRKMALIEDPDGYVFEVSRPV